MTDVHPSPYKSLSIGSDRLHVIERLSDLMRDSSLLSEIAGPVSVAGCPRDDSVEMAGEDSKEEESIPKSSE